jgi:hypothetical protein
MSFQSEELPSGAEHKPVDLMEGQPGQFRNQIGEVAEVVALVVGEPYILPVEGTLLPEQIEEVDLRRGSLVAAWNITL